MVTCILSRAENGNHSRMNTDFVIRPAIINGMSKTIRNDLSYYCNRNPFSEI